MSTYNMMERITKPGPYDLATREQSTPYFYSRHDIEMNDGTPWRQGLRTLRKHWKVSLAFAVILEVAVALLVFSMPNTYQARAVLDVEPPGAEAIGPGGTAVGASDAAGYLDTQTEILRSDGLALGVVEQLHLDQNPIFMKQTFLQRSVAWLSNLLKGDAKSGQQKDLEKIVNTFHNGLSVNQVKGSQLVEVTYQTREPQLAAQIVNSMVDQYLDKSYRSRYEATLRAAQSLSPRLKDLQTSIKKSTDELLSFQRNHEGAQLGSAAAPTNDGMMGPATAASGNPIAVRVAELNQQLTQAMGDRLQQESYIKQISSGNVDSLPQMRDSQLIQGLTGRLVDSRAELAQSLAVFGNNNPQVRKLEQQTDELNKQLDAERMRIATQIQSAYNSSKNREQLIRNTLNGMKGQLDRSNADVVQYDALKRQADSDSNLYTTLSSRVKELAMSGSLTSSNIRVLDEARTPVSPDGPHRFRLLAVGAMFGLLGGVILAFAAENMNDTISSVEDLRRWSGLPALAMVPRISLPGQTRGFLSSKTSRAMTRSISTVRANGLKFLTENPHSPEAEAIRNLETALRIPLPGSDRHVQAVLITSALPAEGKTTVATNLALALARHGTTCLLDADFRRPSITPSFGLTNCAGLQDLLASPELSVAGTIKPIPEIPNLTVIGIGNRWPNGLETLTSKRMADLVNELRKKFDYIVIDSPPIIPFSEGRWLSTISDASILVARCDTTTRGALTWSLEILEELKAQILGVVLNSVDLDAEYYSYGVKDYGSYAAK